LVVAVLIENPSPSQPVRFPELKSRLAGEELCEASELHSKIARVVEYTGETSGKMVKIVWQRRGEGMGEASSSMGHETAGSQTEGSHR
jgi:hypothetical protein